MRPSSVYMGNVSKYITTVYSHVAPDLSSMITLLFDIA